MTDISGTLLFAAALAPGLGGSINLTVDHTSYSAGRGTRTISTVDTVGALGEDTKLYLNLSGGERRISGDSVRAARMSGTLRHDWTSRLSTNVSAAAATNGKIFASREFAGEINYKLTHALVATAGGKHASYFGGDRATTWSAGIGYYRPGFSATYRYNLIDSHLLGRSHAQLATLRLKDPGGSGATQLWFGEGTSLYDHVAQETVKAGHFTSFALRREQPFAGKVRLNLGVSRTRYRTPTGSYSGLGLMAGVTIASLML